MKLTTSKRWNSKGHMRTGVFAVLRCQFSVLGFSLCRWTSSISPTTRGRAHWMRPVLALGNFDGLHRGHRKILDRVSRVASERGATAVVMTFDPHPPRVVRPDKAPPLLMTKAQKLRGVRGRRPPGRGDRPLHRASCRAGIRRCSCRTVLVDWLRVSEVWVGANFLFGHDRTGNFSLLRALGARYGFRAEKIDPVRYKDFVVSSTRIRRLIGEGRVDEAGALLGHQYYIEGHVVRGDQRGRTHRLSRPPTSARENELPAAARRLRDDDHDRRRSSGRRSPTSACGRRSTHPGTTTVETHIFDLDRDLYGAAVRVGFVQRLRDERPFESLDLLKAQIAADCGAGARAVRSPFAVGSRAVSTPDFLFSMRLCRTGAGRADVLERIVAANVLPATCGCASRRRSPKLVQRPRAAAVDAAAPTRRRADVDVQFRARRRRRAR